MVVSGCSSCSARCRMNRLCGAWRKNGQTVATITRFARCGTHSTAGCSPPVARSSYRWETLSIASEPASITSWQYPLQRKRLKIYCLLAYTRRMCYNSAVKGHTKARTNVSIDGQLLEQARAHNISLSPLLEDALRERLRKIEEDAWRSENREAFDSYAQFVAEHGVFSDGWRTF